MTEISSAAHGSDHRGCGQMWISIGGGPPRDVVHTEKHLSWWRNRMWWWRCKMREESLATMLWIARDRKPIQTRLNKTSNLSKSVEVAQRTVIGPGAILECHGLEPKCCSLAGSLSLSRLFHLKLPSLLIEMDILCPVGKMAFSNCQSHILKDLQLEMSLHLWISVAKISWKDSDGSYGILTPTAWTIGL